MPRNRIAVLLLAASTLLLVAACGSPAAGSTGERPEAASARVGNPPSPVTLQEAGSSTMYPYVQVLTSPLHQRYSNITLETAAGGSGVGQSEAIAGTIDVGASDAYLSPAQFKSTPGILNIPVSVSSLVITFNVKGLSSINLSGPVLAGIYQGRIRTWNDSAIAALNPGVTLPNQRIVPIRRVDSSGDTFDLTEFLSASTGSWENGPGIGTTVSWPAVSGELAESGDPGMISGMSSTPGSIGYVGISYAPQALQTGLGQAALRNRAGKFVKSDATTVQSAVAQGSRKLPADLAASLVDEPGAQSYPIVSYDYLVVRSQQSDANTALALRTFITWAISSSGGASEGNLSAVGFQPLPAAAVAKDKNAISRIKAG